MSDSSQKDQRKHPRYNVELGTVAVFSGNGDVIPGQILDISMGGVAFYYFEGEEWSGKASEVYNLFGEGFHLDNVPLELISDYTIVADDHPIHEVMGQIPPGSKKIHRRSVKFKNLNNEQKAKLEEFLKTSHIVSK